MSAPISVTLPDERTRELPAGATGLELAAAIGKRLAQAAVAIRVDGKVQSLQQPLPADCTAEILTRDSAAGLEVLRHSAAHVLADAVKRLRPHAKLWKGPAVDDPRYGFYYDIDLGDEPLTNDDLPELERLMGEIIAADVPFEREELPREAAVALMTGHGEDYKLATIAKIPAGEPISFYRSGSFVDLCRGPHVPRTGAIGDGYAVLALAGAYFGDDARNRMLTRVYGHAFADRKTMASHRGRLEEAKQRDHRRLGVDLDLFSTMGDLGAGLVLWHPKGGLVRHKIEELWRQRHLEGGYGIVCSPHIARSELWRTSGHLGFFRESMYPPMDVDGSDYLMKPMNCPFHIQIYKSTRRSYRELPFRWAELGTVYRYEPAGALHGLTRVRGFTQDDAHLFLRPEQLDEEIERCLRFVLDMLAAFGFERFALSLSTRPAKAVGSDAEWERATAALRKALEALDLEYRVDEGGGAFYGPKIDVGIEDCLGRLWQCSTVQADFNMPERFDLTYVDQSGGRTRPVMIHRALLGSLERFFGLLIEHYGGAFPVWLAPVQAVILAVGERHRQRVTEIAAALCAGGFRVEADAGPEKVGHKVRYHLWQEKVPLVAVVGDTEIETGAMAVRHRSDGDLGALDLAGFRKVLQDKIAQRR